MSSTFTQNHTKVSRIEDKGKRGNIIVLLRGENEGRLRKWGSDTERRRRKRALHFLIAVDDERK